MPIRSITVGTGSGGLGSSVVSLLATIAFANGNGGAATEPLSITNPNAPIQSGGGSFATGDNTINVPSGAGGFILVPSQYNSTGPGFKLTSGTNAALQSHPHAPLLFYFTDAPPASLVFSWSRDVNVIQPIDAVGANVFTVVGHTLAEGDRVKFSSNALPESLDEDTWYYVISVSGDDFSISLTEGGDPVEFSSSGETVNYTTSQEYTIHWL